MSIGAFVHNNDSYIEKWIKDSYPRLRMKIIAIHSALKKYIQNSQKEIISLTRIYAIAISGE